MIIIKAIEEKTREGDKESIVKLKMIQKLMFGSGYW
jgi:hypothetical protein